MGRSDNDLLRIPENELQRLPLDELLRMVVICRDSPDQPTRMRAKAAWEMLITLDIDRVRALVGAFRLREHPGVHIARDDVDDVTTDCFLRLVKMLGTFKGTSVGEYRAAMRTCVSFECRDHLRQEMGEEMKRKGSLDEKRVDKEGDSRPLFDRELAKREEHRIREEEALEKERRYEQDRGGQVRAAIEQIKDERKRRVLELTFAGRQTKEIMAEIDTSADNVYQLRRRALAELGEILDGDDKP